MPAKASVSSAPADPARARSRACCSVCGDQRAAPCASTAPTSRNGIATIWVRMSAICRRTRRCCLARSRRTSRGLARSTASARLAEVHEMILRLPDGYETMAGGGGARLSGGQIRRFALARALYGDPQLVVLDEPEAHHDAEGQETLKTTLRALKARGTTVVVVGHRLGLMAQLDKIAVIGDGTLHAFGPAPAVLARSTGANVRSLSSQATGAKAATA